MPKERNSLAVLYGASEMFPLNVSAVAVSLSLKTSTLAMIQLRSVGEWKTRSLVKLAYVAFAGSSTAPERILKCVSHYTHTCTAVTHAVFEEVDAHDGHRCAVNRKGHSAPYRHAWSCDRFCKVKCECLLKL